MKKKSLQHFKFQGWNGFGIAEPILKVMAEKGFKEPTEIQALTFPAAILGRRDILGAAETGLFSIRLCWIFWIEL